jgi:hypothetical protein
MNLALTAKKNNYYVQESVGIAAGFCCSNTSSRFGFFYIPLVRWTSVKPLADLKKKPFLLIPVGYPAEDCWVPDKKEKDSKIFVFSTDSTKT